MSWHCLICSGSDHWVRGKEDYENAGFVELIFKKPFSKKKVEYVVHASCLKKVLEKGLDKYAQSLNGDELEFLEEWAKQKEEK